MFVVVVAWVAIVLSVMAGVPVVLAVLSVIRLQRIRRDELRWGPYVSDFRRAVREVVRGILEVLMTALLAGRVLGWW